MKYIKFFILAGLMIAMAGCEFTSPKRVRIKTDPTMTVPLGTRQNIFRNDIELDTELEELTMETIDGQPNEDYVEGLSIVDVAPGEPKTVHLSTAALDISVSDFAGETLQLDNISQSIDPVDFTVPDLDFADQTIGIDPPYRFPLICQSRISLCRRSRKLQASVLFLLRTLLPPGIAALHFHRDFLM